MSSKTSAVGVPGRAIWKRVSPDNQPGQHAYQISADAKYAIHTFHNSTTPPVISLINLQNHEVIRVLEDNKELSEKITGLNLNRKEFIKLNIRDVGNVTHALSQLKKGDTVLVRGPYGKVYPMHQVRGNSIIVIGGGCGVAPLKGAI